MKLALAAALGACLLAVAEAPATAKESCVTPPDLVRLDAPLPRTGAKLRAGEDVTIVAIGSSSTAGFGATLPTRTYPSRLAAELSDRFPDATVHVLNKGVGGEIAADMVKRFDRDVFSLQPDLVIWQVGSNGILNDLDIPSYSAVVRDGVEQLRQAGIDVMIMDLQFAPKILAHPHVGEMEHALTTIAAEEEIPIFHRWDAMEHWIRSGQLTFKKMLSKDGLHMNDFSYGCVGRLLADAIAERVRQPAVASRR